tara:strand:+ start:96 stop:809 length:714 start_codon:yes stop_codon:yes gene_type:complete
MMSEIWIEIEDAKGYYVSNLGRFKSPNKFLTPTPDSNGYARVGIKGRTRRCHRIVAIHHISNPENKLEVNHKDGNKMNCCVSNLEWCTAEENRKHYMDNLYHKKDSKGISPSEKYNYAMKERGRINKELGIYKGSNNPMALGKHKIYFIDQQKIKEYDKQTKKLSGDKLEEFKINSTIKVIIVDNLTRWSKDNGYDDTHIHRLKYGGFFQKSINKWKTVNRCKDIIKIEHIKEESND